MDILQKKVYFTVLSIFLACITHAQIRSVEVGVDGLTCSQCSRSVEMQLRKLPFIKKVDANLKETSFHISIDDKSKVDLEKITKGVKNAGFSVRYLQLQLDPKDIDLSGDFIQIRNDWFQMIPNAGKANQSLNYQVIAKGFLPKKEFEAFKQKYTSRSKSPPHYFLKPISK